jgi:hypothetical protein
MVLAVNVSAMSGSGTSLTVTLQGKDVVSGQYYTVLTSAAITTAGLTVLRIYPGISASANAAANDVLPPVWRVTYAIAGTSPPSRQRSGPTCCPELWGIGGGIRLPADTRKWRFSATSGNIAAEGISAAIRPRGRFRPAL